MYTSFENLVECRGLNCRIDLGGMKLTQWQLDALKEFLNSIREYRLIYKSEDILTYNLTIVNTMQESDLQIKLI